MKYSATSSAYDVEILLYRLILVTAAVAVTLFGHMASATLPGAMEYPAHRWMLSSCCLLVFAGSFLSRKIRDNIITLTCWWLFINHIWVTWIVYVNSFDIAYYSGLLTSFCAITIAIRKPALFYIFTVSAVLMAIFAAWMCPSPDIHLSMIIFTMLILGAAFILTNIAILAFQKSLLNRNAELEKAVEERAAIAEKRAGQLASKNKELEQFAYIASHDLKSPLRNIGGFAQLLQKRLGSTQEKEVNEYIEFIVGGVKRMNHLIEDVLLYSRFGEEATCFKLEKIAPIVQEAIAALQWEIQEKHAIVYSEGLLHSLYCDRPQMVQLFQNLISNAIKYNNASRPIIKICLTANVNEFLFSIKDNGIGIPPEQQERVFKMFQRLHTEQEYAGTGIGLAVCKRIIENHQGRIWISSNTGAGTKFYFTISKYLDKEKEASSRANVLYDS
ncbi:MAG: GHKL domain-containing protein [Lewinellaceae bacterium]|nr:GHKL domain-containing protein [Saprospiraceae bacterium]MCB9336896.1 GHKL domain-containing protein [Lewinellaceae bacterium]